MVHGLGLHRDVKVNDSGSNPTPGVDFTKICHQHSTRYFRDSLICSRSNFTSEFSRYSFIFFACSVLSIQPFLAPSSPGCYPTSIILIAFFCRNKLQICLSLSSVKGWCICDNEW